MPLTRPHPRWPHALKGIRGMDSSSRCLGMCREWQGHPSGHWPPPACTSARSSPHPARPSLCCKDVPWGRDLGWSGVKVSKDHR